jgi:hypothetical protein
LAIFLSFVGFQQVFKSMTKILDKGKSRTMQIRATEEGITSIQRVFLAKAYGKRQNLHNSSLLATVYPVSTNQNQVTS